MRDMGETLIKMALIPAKDMLILTSDVVNLCTFFIPGKRLCVDLAKTGLHGVYIGWHLVFPIYEACITGIDVLVQSITKG